MGCIVAFLAGGGMGIAGLFAVCSIGAFIAPEVAFPADDPITAIILMLLFSVSDACVTLGILAELSNIVKRPAEWMVWLWAGWALVFLALSISCT